MAVMQRVILVTVNPKYLIESDRKRLLAEKNRRDFMNYIEMAEAVKTGKKARRASWPEEQYIWFAMQMMLHTHPYWPDQGKVRFADIDVEAFPYICEKDDALTTDWELVSA